MARRLPQRFPIAQRVEIRFGDADDQGWMPAYVVRHQPPGIWVRTGDGREWFVTNGRRIRAAARPSADG